MDANKKLLWAVLFPLLVMLGWLGNLTYLRESGVEVELPITGYDPRDLIAGNYLQFRVTYGPKGGCPKEVERNQPVCQCLSKEGTSASVYWAGACDIKPSECTIFIKGKCPYYQDFIAGIERFYISEEKSQARFQPSPNAKVKLRVPSNGQALVVGIIP